MQNPDTFRGPHGGIDFAAEWPAMPADAFVEIADIAPQALADLLDGARRGGRKANRRSWKSQPQTLAKRARKGGRP